MTRRTLHALLLAAAAALPACQPGPRDARETPPASVSEAPPAPASRAAAVTAAPGIDELLGATFEGIEIAEGPVTLSDGAWEGRPYAEGGASRPRVELVREFRLAGDLDGDGTEEAAVLLASTAGGSGVFTHLALVARRGEGPANVGTAPVGDRVQIRGGRIEKGRILLDVLQAGRGDPACCPGDLLTRAWTLGPGGLKETDPAALGRLSPEAIAGSEWVLRRWSLAEPAPPEPEVTLVYEAGQVAGSNGCNRYVAEVRPGAAAGQIDIGPAGSTRRACPEPMAGVESRFMGLLAAVRKHSFLNGRLALTYDRDGAVESMIFEPRER